MPNQTVHEVIALCFDTYEQACVAHRTLAESKSVHTVVYAHGKESITFMDGRKIYFKALDKTCHPPRGMWCSCFAR